MNIYYVYQDTNQDWDSYDGFVVIAESPEAAKKIHPSGLDQEWDGKATRNWTDIANVQVKFIGTADPALITDIDWDLNHRHPIICASFNAG